MRTNGVLQYQILSDDQVEDQYGEISSEATPEWSEEIPCSIKTNSDSRKGSYEDGEFRNASFTILIELEKFPYKRIRLKRLDEDLGEFQILSSEPLTTVGRTQIIV